MSFHPRQSFQLVHYLLNLREAFSKHGQRAHGDFRDFRDLRVKKIKIIKLFEQIYEQIFKIKI